MSERPILSRELRHDEFLQYYYLKEELVVFCKENELTSTGGKQIITKRIAHYLETGEEMATPMTKKKSINVNCAELSLESIIEENFVCSEEHRTFFKTVIGKSFSFNVVFQQYLKSNAGKSYSAAVDEWYKIQVDKKKNRGKSTIDSQFEYNTYIRDFFKDNNDKTLKDAIKCWKYRKKLKGHNKYVLEDLVALER